jgi:hypothetical protein
MPYDLAIAWVRKFLGEDCPEDECWEAYKLYRIYRDEGQNELVSRQYAGLL